MLATAAEYSPKVDEGSVPIYVVAVGQVRMEELYRRPQLGEANKAIDANGFDWLPCAFPSPLRPS